MIHVGRVVLDCNIILQALASSNGAAYACIELIEAGAAALVISDQILTEYREVLSRPELQHKFPTLTADAVNKFLHRLTAISTRIDPVAHVVTLPRDPDDEPYLDLAVAAGASYLVTRDNDLLDLARLPLPLDLAKLLASVVIVDPLEFLRRCRGQ